MKKVFIAVAAMAMFSLASCKKEYTCACSFDGETEDFQLAKMKKGDAETACTAQETNLKAAYADAACEIK